MPAVDGIDYVRICISTYPADQRRLDDLVRALKQRGHTKANRSLVIRIAIEQLGLEQALAAIDRVPHHRPRGRPPGRSQS